MAEKKFNLNGRQKLAIDTLDRDVIVGASAGTGKTEVLSQRCMKVLSDSGKETDVRGILVLTFTTAAAEEMKSRIASKLADGYRQTGSAYLRRQQLLLGLADISTIDSFCRRIVADNFYRLGIDPTFRIIDSDEQMLVKYEVLDEVVEEAWADNQLAEGLKSLLYSRDICGRNFGFLGNIIRISDFLDSVASRQDWYARAAAAAEVMGAASGRLADKQREIFINRLRECAAAFEYSKLLNDNKGGCWGELIESDLIKPLQECIKKGEKGNWEGCVKFVLDFEKPRFVNKSDIDEQTVEAIKKPIRKAMKTIESLCEFAIINPEYKRIVGPLAGRHSSVAIELVKRFDKRYEQLKRELNCLDFADLEHLALKVLSVEGTNGVEPSEAAVKLRQRYKYIFVDEYQDINPLQEQIIRLLSSENNIFVVGDVKQSIYGWRQAEPAIFLERLQHAIENISEEKTPLRVDLNENYRSDVGILSFVNMVFGRIMTAGVGMVDYDEKAELKSAATAVNKSDAEKPVELYMMDESDGQQEQEDEEDNSEDDNFKGTTARQCEAALIAERIRRMTEGDDGASQIYDKSEKRYRRVEYRDIVILLRSPVGRANDYAEILRLWGIPADSGSGSGYFKTTEISDCISLLKVLDNPQQDIELTAVMRSPLFGFSDTELAKIRLRAGETDAESRHISYFDGICGYIENGENKKLCEKADSFLKRIDLWRTKARQGGIADLLWEIFQTSGYLSFVSALPNGPQRRANLMKLHERAIQFENFASAGQGDSPARFVEFIEELLERGQDWTPAEPDSSVQNAVRIMSIHKSKGLEFPVVFLADLGKRFNADDTRGEFIFDSQDLLGIEVIEKETKSRLSSLAYEVISQGRASRGLSEEMRILYVAMTRAREKLILVGSADKTKREEILAMSLCGGSDGKVADWQIRQRRCCMDWILLGLSNLPDMRQIMEGGEGGNRSEEIFYSKLCGYDELSGLADKITRLRTDHAAVKSLSVRKEAKADRGLLEKVKKTLGWRYEFAAALGLQAKTSAGRVAHQSDEFRHRDYESSLQHKPAGLVVENIDRMSIGTATHLVIERLDLKKEITTDAVREVMEHLLAQGVINEQTVKFVNIEAICGFFASELGKMTTTAGNEVLREWVFTAAIPACRIYENIASRPCNENIVVQGIIDMIIKTAAGLIIVDFKTDWIPADQAAERAKIYRGQVDIYAEAAEKILKTKIAGKWLYFLTPARAISI